jgi:hypothetical protein
MKPWHETNVTYLTDDPISDYAQQIRAANTHRKLMTVLASWRRLAPDAYEQAKNGDWTDLQWAIANAANEQHGERVNDIAGAVLMPATMLITTMTAQQYGTPWGLAFIRLCEVGRIVMGEHGFGLA